MYLFCASAQEGDGRVRLPQSGAGSAGRAGCRPHRYGTYSTRYLHTETDALLKSRQERAPRPALQSSPAAQNTDREQDAAS